MMRLFCHNVWFRLRTWVQRPDALYMSRDWRLTAMRWPRF